MLIKLLIEMNQTKKRIENLIFRTETLTSIAYAILVPNLMFVLSLVVLVYWYCPYCQAKCKKYEQHTDARESHYE